MEALPEANGAKADDHAITITTRNPEDTFGLGARIGSMLDRGDVVALVGELGAGKTWLSKGIAAGLGVPDHEYVNSPAFDLIHEYRGRIKAYHMDFYRLDYLSDEDHAWLAEYLYGDGACIIEWADKFAAELLEDHLRIEISYGPESANERRIGVLAVGERYGALVRRLRE